MSKLLKFRYELSSEEAAEYLSKLIEEPVSESDVLQLYHLGWLPANLLGDFVIVRLMPLLDARGAQSSFAGLPVFLTGDRVGFCVSPPLPCDYVMLAEGESRREAFALRDEVGGFYAIYDNDLEQTLPAFPSDSPEVEGQYSPWASEEAMALREQLFFEPAEIFNFAQMANTPSPSPRPNLRREAEWSSDTKLFNLPSDGKDVRRQNHQAPRDRTSPPQSRALVTAALLDLLSTRRLNQSGVIQEILQRHPNKRGLGKRTLEAAFADARKAWNDE